MTQRFVSGGSGKFTFDVANSILDDVADSKRRGPESSPKSRSRVDKTIAAQLIEQVDPTQINWVGENAIGEDLVVWKWKSLFVDRPTAGRTVAGVNISQGGLHHGSFGVAPSGYAIQISGSAAATDFVVLHPIPVFGSISGERWFVFSGANDPIASGQQGILQIVNSTEIADRKWLYEVRAMRYRFPAGSSTPSAQSIDGTIGLAYNLYEPSLHGQPLTGPNGSLEIGPIPNGSFVLGTYQTRSPNGGSFFVFQATLPMQAVCNGPGMAMMQEQGDGRLMRDGI